MPHGHLEPDAFDRALDAALRRPADAPVPLGFAARTLARLPRQRTSVLPYAIVAAAVVFVLLAGRAFYTGSLYESSRWLAETMARPVVLAVTAGVEIAGSLVWLWRSARA